MSIILTKTQVMDCVVRGLSHEAFTEETYGQFDITVMRQRANKGLYGEVYQSPITPDLIAYVRKFRDWEPSRVWDLMIHPRTPWVDDPGICIFIDDGHMLADGTHRLIARWALGLRDFYFWGVPLADAPRPAPGAFAPFDWGNKEVTADGKIRNRLARG